jgi:hypothetical protein
MREGEVEDVVDSVRDYFFRVESCHSKDIKIIRKYSIYLRCNKCKRAIPFYEEYGSFVSDERERICIVSFLRF